MLFNMSLGFNRFQDKLSQSLKKIIMLNVI